MIRKASLVLGAIAVLARPCFAQNAAAPASEVHQLALEDQRDRIAYAQATDAKKMQEASELMAAHDVSRRKQVHELLEQGVLRTAADFADAALIYQHGEKPDDYLLAHVLAMVALEKGDRRARSLCAVTLDRYLQSIGEAQVFGTQYLTRGYAEMLQQARAARQAASDGKREVPDHGKVGSGSTKPAAQSPDQWIQEPYNPMLISDALRAIYCVESVEDQKGKVAALNGGKEAPERSIPGCSK
ncbi:MAG TPA: hypothetical protein VEW69_12465 [Alphaproteobacteria bacterium]|nr:hypothetical protein [Alphaproteobacteria bacterium]